MRKNLIYAGMLLLGLTVATSCSNEEGLEQILSNGTTIEAVIENAAEARTSVNDSYQVLWTTGDVFDVWNGVTKAGVLELKSGNGSTSGSFGLPEDATEFDVTEGMTAFFPAYATSDAKTYTFSDTYNSQETDAPMLGTFINGKFSFTLLTAMVRVVVANVPAGEAVLTITSEEQMLAGETTLSSENTLGVPTNGRKEVKVTINNQIVNATLTFDIPIPVQAYTNGLSATLKVGEADLFSKKTNGFTAAAGKLYKFEADASVVTNKDELTNALENGGDIVLGEDITLSNTEALVISTTTNIDLNGNSLALNGQTITVSENQSLTIVNNATSAVARNAGNEGVTISSTSDIIKASAGSTITIGEGVNLETSGASSCCIWIPANANDVTVNSAGNLKCTTAGAAVISHNGTLTSGTINITGGSVEHTTDVAVYIAGVAHLNISAGSIKGTTGVEVRAGKLTVTGSPVITSTGVFSEAANGNGTTITGAAVAVSQHTTEKEIEVTVSGTPTFAGEYALYEKDLHQDPTTVEMSITGGTFNGKVYSENVGDFITGGVFSDPSACYYLGANANVTVNMENDYTGAGFKTENGQIVALTIADGKTYTVTAPLVGSAGTQNLGFQFKQGSTVTINGGTITSSDAKMLINNYANLTLNGVTLAPDIPNTMNGQTYYVLSNNCGTVNIEGGTTITAPTSSDTNNCPTVYAFDVCKYASYPNVTVNIKDATIAGNVEYTGAGIDQKLNISGGTITGDLIVADAYKTGALAGGIVITGGNQTGSDWSTYEAIDSAKIIGTWQSNSRTYTFDADGTFDSPEYDGVEFLDEKWYLLGRILILEQTADEDDPEGCYITSITDTEIKGYPIYYIEGVCTISFEDGESTYLTRITE